jgi:hypothetical protein
VNGYADHADKTRIFIPLSWSSAPFIVPQSLASKQSHADMAHVGVVGSLRVISPAVGNLLETVLIALPNKYSVGKEDASINQR